MASDDYVSPYLLRPLRSYAQALHDRERCNTGGTAPGHNRSADVSVSSGAGPRTCKFREEHR